jgi:hypothetical protein
MLVLRSSTFREWPLRFLWGARSHAAKVRKNVMIDIPTPTPSEIEAVLVGMMDGTNAFGRWVKLDDAHLPCGGEETRVGHFPGAERIQ